MTDNAYITLVSRIFRVALQSHIRFARKVQKHGDAFSKSSSIFVMVINYCKV